MKNYTAIQILDLKEPETLFTPDVFILEKEYKELRITWHPDRCTDPKATEVYQHLTELFEMAKLRLKAGVWNKPNYLQLLDITTAKPYEVHYLRKKEFELGAVYISKTIVTYLINKDYKDLYENALRMIKGFTYSSKKMEEEIARYLPKIKIAFETNNYCVLIIEKPANVFSLQHIKEAMDFSGKEMTRHIAWIMSTMYNLSCYMQYTGISNNGIDLDSYFIAPEQHSGLLLGGWWYGARQGEKLKALPESTIGCIPSDVLSDKRFNYRIDLELIRGVGRQLLTGSMNKIHLVRAATHCPQPLRNWLTGATLGDARTEYEEWQDVLTASFGKRKFVKMEVSADEIYRPK